MYNPKTYTLHPSQGLVYYPVKDKGLIRLKSRSFLTTFWISEPVSHLEILAELV